MRLILVRHPQPLADAGVCYGSSDLAVAPDEMARVLVALSATLPQGLPLYSSPLRRCAELAAQLAPRLQSPAPMLDARLAELDFGNWEMRCWDDIPRAEIDAWSADLAGHHPGGGESVLQMALRVADFHADLRRARQDVIIICHAGAMRLLAASQLGMTPPQMALHAAQTPHKIAYGEILILRD